MIPYMRAWLSKVFNLARANHGENRIEALADGRYKEGRFDALEDDLARFDPDRLAAEERESWYSLWGIAAFQRNDRPEALHRFTVGFEACPDSGHIAFSLGQERQNIGDAHGMFDLFDRFRFPQVPANHAMVQARYAYLWDRPEKSISYILPMIDLYYELGIADDTFLHIRGMPFFSVVWSSLGAYFELTDNLEAFSRLTETAAERLSDVPFDFLNDQLTAVISGDFSTHLSNLTTQLNPEYGRPVGYTKLKIAIISGLSADPTTAEDHLAAVQLESDDFPWLDDLRTLARARIAHVAGDETLEADLQNAFLERQPLLFEPEHVFDSRLVDYQKRLTRKYRQKHLTDPE